ncbi:MAG: RidA family protein [Nocardioides sp.]|uniref:RidA family protein n=1 Tax=Nocardioides sp. TaxID=35761 RepID=UPI0039E69B5F
MKTPIRPAEPGGAPLSKGMIANGFCFVAGHGGRDPRTGELAAGIEAQTRQSLANIESVLAEAGLDLRDVVKVNAWVANLEDVPGYNRVYAELMPAPHPVRATVGSALQGGMLVEIEATAALREA